MPLTFGRCQSNLDFDVRASSGRGRYYKNKPKICNEILEEKKKNSA